MTITVIEPGRLRCQHCGAFILTDHPTLCAQCQPALDPDYRGRQKRRQQRQNTEPSMFDREP